MRERSIALVTCLLLGMTPELGAQFPPELRGRVIDRVGGSGISGATVGVVGSSLEAVSGPNGEFNLRGLVPGSRELLVRALGYRAERVAVEAENGQSKWVVVELDRAPVRLDELIVRGNTEGAEPASGVIDRARIEASGARDLGELLQDEPGVTVTRRGGPGAPTYLSMRGSSANEVLVLVDGTPLNSPFTGEADLSSVSLETVQRVRVWRGNQSVRYGARALAGVVAVETRTPAVPDLSVRLGAGAFGERSAAFGVGTRSRLGGSTVGGVAAGEWRGVTGDFGYRVPDLRGGGTARRRNADASLVSLAASGSAERSGLALRTRVEGLRVSRGMPGSIVQPSPDARQRQHRVSGGLGAEVRSGRLTVHATVDAGVEGATFRDSSPPFGPAVDENVRVRTVQGTVGAGTRVGGLDLNGGAEARGLFFTSTLLADRAPSSQTILGAWVSGGAAWRLGNRWLAELRPAVRVDQNSVLDRPILSPQVSASIGTTSLTFRISTGNAFSPPSLADQFFQEGVLARPNPNLQPERVRGEVEGGVELREAEVGPLRVDAQFAAYRADVDGMILWFPDFRFIWQPDNFEVRRRGWDAAARLRFAAAHAEVRGSVSRVAVEYASPSLTGQVIYRPKTTASGAAAGVIASVRAEFAARYFGPRRTVSGTDLNSLAAYWIADLRVSRNLRLGGWSGELSLAIENLFDHEAAMLVDYPFPGRAWAVGFRVRPATGRPRETWRSLP